jgi:hypothetical protein
MSPPLSIAEVYSAYKELRQDWEGADRGNSRSAMVRNSGRSTLWKTWAAPNLVRAIELLVYSAGWDGEPEGIQRARQQRSRRRGLP